MGGMGAEEGGIGQRADRGGVAAGHIEGDVHIHNVIAAGEVVWPVRVGAWPAQASAFQPREQARARVEGAWADAGTDSPTKVVVLAQLVVGDGGVGKSQLAASIARDALATGGRDLVVWVPAVTVDQVVGVYAQAARAVHAPGAERDDVGLAAKSFLDWVATTDRSWLVVLDDLTLDAAGMRGLWPDSGTGTGRVLVTTRRRDAALPGALTRVDLGVFSPEESAAYLQRRVADQPGPLPADLMDGAAALAQDLGHLPVALAQAAAVILDQAVTFKQYQDRFVDRSQTLADLFPPDAAADDYAHTVASTWSLAVEHAATLSAHARPAAHLAALIDPNGAPGDLFTTLAARTYLATNADTAASPVDSTQPIDLRATSHDRAAQPFDNDTFEADPVNPQQARAALRALHRLSLITHDPGGGPTAVRIHALAQRAITDTLQTELTAVAVVALADALTETWPDPEPDSTLGAVLRSNTTHLHATRPEPLWQTSDQPKTQGAHPVLFRAGGSLGQTGQVAPATQYFQALLETATERLGSDHQDTLTARGLLAYWQGEAGDPAGAATATEELLADYLRLLGPDHPDTLATRGNLAQWRGVAGDPAGAAAATEELLADQLRALGADHSNTLTMRSHLARWRGVAGDPAGAATAIEELLADYLRLFGPDHPHTLIVRSNLAHWRGRAGDPEGATAATEELLADQLRVLGPDHPSTLTTRSNIARWRGAAGDPAGAATATEELLADRLRVLGPDHPDTLLSRNNLARWRGVAGDPARAAADFEGLLADTVRVLGPDHPDALAARTNLVYWRVRAGKNAGAVSALEELLADQLRVLGPGHPQTVKTRQFLSEQRDQDGAPQ